MYFGFAQIILVMTVVRSRLRARRQTGRVMFQKGDKSRSIERHAHGSKALDASVRLECGPIHLTYESECGATSGVPVLLETKARSNSAGWGKARHGAVHGYKQVKLAQYFEGRSLRKHAVRTPEVNLISSTRAIRSRKVRSRPESRQIQRVKRNMA